MRGSWTVSRPFLAAFHGVVQDARFEVMLGRLFSAFPGELPGIALVLLRSTLGIAVIIEGGYYIGGSNSFSAAWFAGIAGLAAGGLLLIGFLTPIACTVISVIGTCVVLSLLPVSSPNVFDSKSAVIFAACMLVSLIGLGPGAFSMDARVFGRREIIIPRART